MANKYANIKQSTTKGKSGGYKPALFFSPTAAIETWGRPIANPAAIGDKKKITTAHTFADGLTATKWQAKMHSVKFSSKMVGDPGAGELEHTATIVITGDSAEVTEMVEELMNDESVFWLKDADCIDNDSYIQLGDDCNPAEVQPEFDGKDTKAGQKEWTINIVSKKKQFYLAALPIAA